VADEASALRADGAAVRLADDGVLDAVEVNEAVEAVPEAGGAEDHRGPGGTAVPPPLGGDVPPSIEASDVVEAGGRVESEHEAPNADDVEPEAQPVASSVGRSEEVPPNQPGPATGASGHPGEAEPPRSSVLMSARESDLDHRAGPPDDAGDSTRRAVEELLTRLAGEASLIHRLRMLARAAGRMEGLDLGQMLEILERFPPGWAQRRALEALFRAGHPGSLETAIAGIRSLKGRSQRVWAATTLAGSRFLDAAERERLIRTVDSKVVERRLNVRFG
jgi:hypothetical protein